MEMYSSDPRQTTPYGYHHPRNNNTDIPATTRNTTNTTSYTVHSSNRIQQHSRGGSLNKSPSSSWIDAAVLHVAMACNFCDTYSKQQVQYERHIERQDTPLFEEEEYKYEHAHKHANERCVSLNAASWDWERRFQVEVYRQFLFDEASVSVRLEDDDNDNDNPELSLPPDWFWNESVPPMSSVTA
jgi:hypothetical protein